MSSEDKYDTLEKIGHGSFGVIRKVRRKVDGFIMCRKEISYLRMSQKEREQLHAEFQILSTLRHPNIVAYYHREHLKISQDLHLYMEYCGNGDLGRIIKDLAHRGQWAQESFVWSIFSQLVLALFRCHYGVNPPEVGSNVLGLTQGTVATTPKVPAGTMTILHRDLKPENVFLGADNSVKLGDFGLSKMIKSHDFASTYVGTPFYMSPEICAAEKYTLKSDIWALGCIIYELCAREPPFNAKSHFQLSQKIKEGKVPPLPDVYSPELGRVIRDCLKVNPDRRPDTAQLLNLPVVRLMRKEMETVELNKKLKAREESVRKKEESLREALENVDRDKEAIRQELDSSLRREWEVKARLEIDRLTNAEIERLQNRFEEEVQARVQAELSRRLASGKGEEKTVSFKAEEVPLPTPEEDFSSSKSDYPHSSVGASGDDFPSTTDISEYSGLESPDTSRDMKRPNTRTPFARAQTMYAGQAGTPMDIEMVSPSPAAIASLSLSPRRNGATKAPSAPSGNIFSIANASGLDAKWDLPRGTHFIDSDDEDDTIPSPTRNIRSSKNPFTSKTRPVLMSQKSCPLNRLQTKNSSGGLISKQTGLTATPAAASAPQAESGSRSPGRRLSKIPSAATLGESPALSRKPSFTKKNGGSNNSDSDSSLGKVAAKNNIKGRTLVELQQARAGGRPLSAMMGPLPPMMPSSGENGGSPKRTFKDRIAGVGGGAHERRLSAGEGGQQPAVWDPERDEMPSPFLVRQRRMIRD